MKDGKIYFDEKVNGHNLVVTSKVIVFRGKQLDTSLVDTVSTSVRRGSVNGIPSSGSFKVSVAAQHEKITVDCAVIFWIGQSQFERLRGAIVDAVGSRLIVNALSKLMADDKLIFEHKGSLFEKDSRFILSRSGILIEQEGLFGHRVTMIEWRDLRMQSGNGTCYLQSYSSGKKVNFQIWHMSNNMVFGGVLDYLLDRAH